MRLVFWAKPDNHDPDPIKDAGKFKRGDLVAVLPDGADPGRDVMTLGWWRVVDVPDATIDDAIVLMSEQKRADGIVPRKRLNGISLDAIEAAAAQKLGRALKTGEIIAATRAQITAARAAKANIPDPRRF